jgi:DegV family protein with EDD domain
VFPVPDGDTGTNLALTLRAMAESVEGLLEDSVAAMAARLAEAGVVGARGNSGMMMSHFFLGFAEGLGGRKRVGPEELAVAMRRASDSIYQSVDRPIEGTILTVVREATEAVERISQRVPDLTSLAEQTLKAARESLARTPQLLPVLREAKVVDAGARGFVCFLEGMVSLINGRATRAPLPGIAAVPDAAASAAFPEDGDRAFRYCTEFVVRGAPPPERKQLAAAVRGLGGSLIVTRASSLAKVHIHTDEPARVEASLASLGSAVERVKAEDMREQHRARRQRKKRSVALVTDTTCDLPPELIIEHDITVVPLVVVFGERSFLDQVDIGYEEFLERLTDPAEPHPTTSQPAPAHFEAAFARAAEHGEEVLGLFVSGTLSGTLGQARAAAARQAGIRIQFFDSLSASLGLGFQVLRAAEMIREGRRSDEVVAELERLRPRSGLLLTVDTLTYLMRSGRLGKARGYLGNILHLKPVLGLDQSGAIVAVDRVRGREAVAPRVLEYLRAHIPEDRAGLRMGVVHVAGHTLAEDVAASLREEFGVDDVMIRPAAGVLAAHVGPGAWGVFYQAL